MANRILAVAFPIVFLMMGGPASAAPTFSKDVLPLLQKNCQSCHRPGQIGPFSPSPTAGSLCRPDPGKWVYYGGQSWEEMGTPNMGFLIDRNADENDFIK